jgi:hypothetical protein
LKKHTSKKPTRLRQAEHARHFAIKIFFAVLASIIFSTSSFAQDANNVPLPKKIRGYKVHNEIIKINLPDNGNAVAKRAIVELDDPVLKDVSFSGVIFSIDAEITSLEQSGSIDRVSFYDLKVNGIPVSVKDIEEKFTFKEDEPFRLPKPAEIELSASSIVQAGWKEIREKKEKWLITGRIFVFGKFRRYGFNFKRAVPVDVSIEIDNPLFSK